MASRPRPFLSEEQYLAIERAAEGKSEYYNGEMYAMAGGTSPHSRLQMALALVVGRRVDRERCAVHGSDMRVRVTATVQLPAIGVEFPVEELYKGVKLADPPASRPKSIGWSQATA